MAKAKSSTEVLKAGLWILENVGWIQNMGSRTDNKGKYVGFCAYGALQEVQVSYPGDRDIAINSLRKAMGGSIVGFNDDDKTTKQMVINRFKRAIKDSK